MNASASLVFICALIYAFAVSVSESMTALLAASVLPVVCLCLKKISLPHLVKLNVINVIMILTLALTWPNVRDGFIMGAIIALRVNMIYVVFAALVFPLGLPAIYALPLPEKLRVLVILTVRGIHILRESLETAFLAAGLRAPNAGLMMRLKIFAYVLGSSLLRSSDRSERMMYAVQTRGGFGGFRRSETRRLHAGELMMLVLCAGYSGLVVMMNYA